MQGVYSTFWQMIQSVAAYHYGCRKIVTFTLFRFKVAIGQVHTLSTLTDCNISGNISYDGNLSDALNSTMQLRQSIYAGR